MADATARYIVRLYQPEDRPAIRDICVRTCWMGEYRPECVPDEWMWAEFWTRYFTDREPEHTWVVERQAGGHEVVGYLTGTMDVRRCDRYGRRLIPGLAWHVIRHRLIRRRASRRALLAMAGGLLRGELGLPKAIVRQYPATCHCNLLAEARGGGWAGQMMLEFCDAMRNQRVPGVHAQTLSINDHAGHVLEKAGMALLERHPITVFRHVDPRPIEVRTYGMRL